ncbi:hypothetical protein NE237_018086 [Protea cynaroides]|uniref:Uncharacterized protein n=1 Tax=Protea cynaroides TaxID=273540 RepID=A0A9Q0QNN3_9MAGN|nr:hypothetical protein NE237_018086 [Protea cynaroides]
MALQLAMGSSVHMVFKAAIELNLFEIIATAGPGKQLSAVEIASLLPTQNPDAPDMLDRILRLLASYSILTFSEVTAAHDHRVQRLYGLAPVSELFVSESPLAPLTLMIQDKVFMESWHHLKDAVLEGGIAFNKAYGMQMFEYLALDPRFNQLFNKTMSNLSSGLMIVMLETYDGFENANVVVDVGGGLGETLGMITYKYPTIKGINFDLPHVIDAAPAYPGVEHVAGDMFLYVPKGDIIFMKMILHDWSDEHCLKILKKCYEALPKDGKVVVVETILPATPKTNLLDRNAFRMDILMMIQHIGGKERTEKEYSELAKSAGFNGYRLINRVITNYVMEFHKEM